MIEEEGEGECDAGSRLEIDVRDRSLCQYSEKGRLSSSIFNLATICDSLLCRLLASCSCPHSRVSYMHTHGGGVWKMKEKEVW